MAQAGDHSGATAILDSLLSLRHGGYAQPTAVAAVYNGLGDDERALDWLDVAYQERSGVLAWVAVDPLWKRLRGHPRFRQLIARIFPQPRTVRSEPV